MSRRYFVAGNWKMHNDLSQGRALVRALKARLRLHPGVDVAVCPPFPLLHPMCKELDGTEIKLGAQNCYFEPKGAFTGEVSPAMLKAAGCEYVIVGHSERRQQFGESGDLLRRKVNAVLEHGMQVIFCIGETLAQREAGETTAVVERQMDEVLGPHVDHSRLTVAYEPVWAIGTGRTATPEQAQEVHGFIRGKLSGVFGGEAAEGVRIQYGGSVKPDNAASLLAGSDVDGALVGGACLEAESFAHIIEAAATAAGS